MNFQRRISESPQNLSGECYNKDSAASKISVPGQDFNQRYTAQCIALNGDPLLLVKATITSQPSDASNRNEFQYDAPLSKLKFETTLQLDTVGEENLMGLLLKLGKQIFPGNAEVTIPLKSGSVTAKVAKVRSRGIL
jgi:hypothetical protein